MRPTQTPKLPRNWVRGRDLSAQNLQETTAAVQGMVKQLNAGGQGVPRLAIGGVAGLTVSVSSFPTFDPANPSLLNVVRHPSLIGDPAEEFPVAGWFDTFPAAFDIYTYTYSDINTRQSNDGGGSIIDEELTPRILVSSILLVSSIEVDETVTGPPAGFETKTIDLWRQPGQWWASDAP